MSSFRLGPRSRVEPDWWSSLRDQLSEFYLAVADAIPDARAAVVELAAHAGLAEEQLNEVRLAVSEAVTNAMRHAYRGKEAGSVQLTAAEDPGLGWGLTLIAEVSKQYVVTERATGGTELRMRFPLSDGESAPA